MNDDGDGEGWMMNEERKKLKYKWWNINDDGWCWCMMTDEWMING